MALRREDILEGLYVRRRFGVAGVVYVDGSSRAAIDADTATRENITGWTIRWRVWDSGDYAEPLIDLTATITDGPNGEYFVAGAPEDTDFAPGMKVRTCERVDSGYEFMLCDGRAHFRAGGERE